MISLICTKCKATLEMDDAFAGGVCRCQHCGTIQTVPSRLKGSGRPSSQKALYAGAGNTSGGGAGGAMPSSGLDDLANVVASSGISSHLASRASSSASSKATKPGSGGKPTSKTPLYLAIGGCAVLAIVVVILLVTRGGGDKPGTTPEDGTQRSSAGGGQATGGGQTPAPQVNKPSGPRFGTLPISGSKVVYVIDRGSASMSVFDPLKSVIVDSVTSLGPAAKFQVIFWTAGGPKDNPNEFAYPKGKLVSASTSEAESLRKELEDISTGGATEINAALKEALKRDPDLIIIATGKDPLNLPDTFAADVKKIRGNKSVRIHAIDLTEAGSDREVFEKITSSTGGAYVNIKPGELRK